ncbi:LCP family protein [Marisediminicola senii]|uniref:LCP family protein n=1 Tax=Marisediminicola senii TaxID=2711233 RepID=UPI0013ECB552|nr:LCP family protein [Marisediminicola senii]
MSDSSPAARRRAEGSATPVARHGNLGRKHPLAFVLKIVAASLAVLLVSGLSVVGIAVAQLASAVQPGVALEGEDDENAPEIGAIEGAVNLLLVGSDSGGGNAAYGERGEVLNDVTMLLHISEDHQRATVVSFPRDLYVDIPACTGPDGTQYEPQYGAKINQALSQAGLSCVVQTVNQLTGIDIPYAAVIEFDGVIAMSNAVGGVPVCVATDIDDRQISFQLEAGEHSLSGRDALQFLRSRYGVGDGSDLTRISNQQQFLSSLVRTLKSSETLSNPVKLYGIASAALNNLEFSNSLRNVDTMVSIAGALRDIPLEEVVFAKYPTADQGNGLVPISDAADELIAAIQADQAIGLTGGTGRGTIDVTAPGEPTADPDAPVNPTPTPSGEPGASASAAPETDDRVELSEAVEGQTAAQETCTAGQSSGG